MNSKSLLSEITTDALGYWERYRLIYNGILAIIVIGYLIAALWMSRDIPVVSTGVVLFVLAVGANVVYSTVYVVDLFVQLSDFRETWRRWRWVLFAIGMMLAAIFAIAISHTLFLHHLYRTTILR